MRRTITYVLVLVTILSSNAYAKNDTLLDGDYRAEAIKTEMVYRLLKYISWKSKMLTLCVDGNEMINARMVGLMQKAPNHFSIKTVLNPPEDEINDCQILYISSEQFKKFSFYKNALANKPVLTISDRPHFIDVGGMIGLVEIQGKITIELNMQIMTDHHIKPSPALIEIANRVIHQ